MKTQLERLPRFPEKEVGQMLWAEELDGKQKKKEGGVMGEGRA